MVEHLLCMKEVPGYNCQHFQSKGSWVKEDVKALACTVDSHSDQEKRLQGSARNTIKLRQNQNVTHSHFKEQPCLTTSRSVLGEIWGWQVFD